MTPATIDFDKIKDCFNCYLYTEYNRTAENATPKQLNDAIAKAVIAATFEKWESSRKAHLSGRHAYYFSAEYLLGRMLYNNLMTLGLTRRIENMLSESGRSLSELELIEDPALGNGGLGRLAACFLESAATHSFPLDGYGIKYNFGLFRQQIIDGYQHENIDDWQKNGDKWMVKRGEEETVVLFGDMTVRAIPYDMPIYGYESGNTGTLRLWDCKPFTDFDYNAFCRQDYGRASLEKSRAEDICRVLYPNDSQNEGKKLRLKQEYFLASASLQDIVRKYKRYHPDDVRFSGFAQINVIQLNDTHPVIAIPELIRLFCEEGLSFDDAFSIVKETFCYTNHTIMSEALEHWDMWLLREVLPHLYDIIIRIDKKFKESRPDVPQAYGIIEGNQVNMAYLAVYMSKYVNGVAEIHSEILKKRLLANWHSLYPGKFRNVTNGITQRRFLMLSNPELTDLISGLLKDTSFKTDLSKLEGLKKFADDETVLNRFIEIKRKKHYDLAEYIEKRESFKINPETIFDVQVKRLHEYKRQFLNILSVLELYYEIKEGSLTDFYPTTFIFGAKSAPGYHRAKTIIKLINSVGEFIGKDPDISKLLNVAFISNYDVSYAERITAAADISEQISTAGTEASGTGNMKMMLNGAVTLGTFDGANVEIFREAGEENNYIFGATVEELEKLGDSYHPEQYYNRDGRIRRVLDALVNGTLNGDRDSFRELRESLLSGGSWQKADQYRLLLDFDSYLEEKKKINRDYRNKLSFAKKCFLNTASSGKFSSDRAIRDYAENIWGIKQTNSD